MKNNTLLFVASGLRTLAWVVLVIGVVSSIIIGISAATVWAKIGFLLGGLATAAVFFALLMAVASFLTLAIDNNEKLKEIAKNLKK